MFFSALKNSFDISTWERNKHADTNIQYICNRPISPDNIGKPIYRSGPSVIVQFVRQRAISNLIGNKWSVICSVQWCLEYSLSCLHHISLSHVLDNYIQNIYRISDDLSDIALFLLLLSVPASASKIPYRLGPSCFLMVKFQVRWIWATELSPWWSAVISPQSKCLFPFQLVHTSMKAEILLLPWNAQISSSFLSLPTSLLAH